MQADDFRRYESARGATARVQKTTKNGGDGGVRGDLVKGGAGRRWGDTPRRSGREWGIEATSMIPRARVMRRGKVSSA